MDVMPSNCASMCFFQTLDWDSGGYHQLAVNMRSADQLSSFRTSDWKVPQVKQTWQTWQNWSASQGQASVQRFWAE